MFRATNAEASPVRYGLDPREQYEIMMEIDRSGWTLGAIYHSHTRSPAYPSQTDVQPRLLSRRALPDRVA